MMHPERLALAVDEAIADLERALGRHFDVLERIAVMRVLDRLADLGVAQDGAREALPWG
jgi:hypothetical protein